MKIINAVGPHLPGGVMGMAKQKASTLARAMSIRPFRKTITYTTNSTRDIYVIIIQLGVTAGGDKVTIINGNEFRLISVDNVLNNIVWAGGVPPFTVSVQHGPSAGAFVNVDEDIYTIGEDREFMVSKIDSGDGWWAGDDLIEQNDAGETVVTQHSVGVMIVDSSTPPRELFVPFDGSTVRGGNLYEHFGPLTWCVPTIHWTSPASTEYPTILGSTTGLDAYIHIPGTATELPGVFRYWLDPDYTLLAEGAIPDAGILPVYATFDATDAIHYRTASESAALTIDKGTNEITIDIDEWLTGLDTPMVAHANHNSVGNLLVGDTGRISAHSKSGAAVVYSSSDPSTASINSSTGYITIVSRGYDAGITFTLSCPSTINWLAVSIAGDYHGLGKILLTEGMLFAINDSPMTYGEVLDVLTAQSIPGHESYPATDYAPIGWVVDPTPGVFLQTNTDGTPHDYSITAVFYPLDTLNYESPIGFEEVLTVTQAVPLIQWEGPTSFTQGVPWGTIIKAVTYNPHHIGDPGWVVEGNYTLTISGHSVSAWNGEISDIMAVPDADSGFWIALNFTPTGTEAHNYLPAIELAIGLIINKKPQNITITTKNYYDSGPYTNNTQYFLDQPGMFGGDPTAMLTAQGVSDGSTAPIYFSTASVGSSVTEGIIITTMPGELILVADQAGNTNYSAGHAELILTVDVADTVGITWSSATTSFVYGTDPRATLSCAIATYGGNSYALTEGYSFSTAETYPVVGIYTITITFDPNTSGFSPAVVTRQFTITPKTLYIYAGNNSKTYGSADPTLNYSQTGLINSGVISGALTRTAGEAAGTYPILQGTLSAGGNYNISYTPAVFTIGLQPQSIGPISSVWAAGAGNPPIGSRAPIVGDTATISVEYSGASGNPVTYSSSNAAVCAISGNTLTIIGAGTFNIYANQAGTSGQYAAATTRSSNGYLAGKKPASILSSSFSVVYNGLPQTFPYVTEPPGLTVALLYSGSATPPINVGHYVVTAVIVNSQYSGSWSWSLDITKATPLVNWTDPNAIVYGTALSTAQLNATANVPGIFEYTPAAGEVLGASNTQALAVVFTPTDIQNYTTAEDGVWLQVFKAVVAIPTRNLSTVFTDSPKFFQNITGYNIKFTVAGMPDQSCFVAGYGNFGTYCGVYTIIINIDDPDHAGQGFIVFTITKAVGLITFFSLDSDYTGGAKQPSYYTTPSNLNVTFTYNGTSNRPINPGTYTVVGTINDANYTGSGSALMRIWRVTPTIIWPCPAQITAGEMLSDIELNAYTDISTLVHHEAIPSYFTGWGWAPAVPAWDERVSPGVFTYTPAPGTVMNTRGVQSLSVAFSPTDATKYQPAWGSATITVVATPTYVSMYGSTMYPTYGGPYEIFKSATSYGVDISNQGVWTITKTDPTGVETPANPAALPVGTWIIRAYFSPNDTALDPSFGLLVVQVLKGQPVISWGNPSDMRVGQLLTGTQLNATTGGIPGTLSYLPPVGFAVQLGVNFLTCLFNPTDAANLNSASAIVQVNAIAKTPITFSYEYKSPFNDGRVRFHGGSSEGDGYNCVQTGSLSGITTAAYGTPGTKFLEVTGVGGCYQPGGYFKVSDRNDPDNFSYLYFSDWLPRLTNVNPRPGACSQTPVGPPGTVNPDHVYAWVSLYTLQCSWVHFVNSFIDGFPVSGATWYEYSAEWFGFMWCSDLEIRSQLGYGSTGFLAQGRNWQLFSMVTGQTTVGHNDIMSIAAVNAAFGTSLTASDFGWPGWPNEYVHVLAVNEYK